MRAIIVASLVLLVAVACKDPPGADGRYATPGRGGWDSFRAGAPVEALPSSQTAAAY